MKSNYSTKIKTMKLVLLIGFLLMGLKFFAYYLTQSNAILTDAVESIVNVLAGSFALYSLYYSSQPKDFDHPYGHGKIEFFSTGVEGGMVTVAGLVMLIKGIYSFYTPYQLENIPIGLFISFFSGFINFLLAKLLIKKGNAFNSATLVADGKHLLTDTWSSIGLLIGLGIIYFTNLIWIDYLITIILGIFIIYTGLKLIKEAVSNLLDKTDFVKIEQLISIINLKRKKNWIDIHNLRALKYGSLVHIDCHLTLPFYYSLEESHQEVAELAKFVTSDLNYEIEFFIHSDPCLPTSCSICQISECVQRKNKFIKRVDWKLENVLPDSKHFIS